MLDNRSNKILARIANYLNEYPASISPEQVSEITNCGVSLQYAVALIVANYCDINPTNSITEKEIFNTYFLSTFKELNSVCYANDTYYQNIKFKNQKEGSISLEWKHYKPFECFVYSDLQQTINTTIAPIGFFSKTFNYPAILENNHIWMSVTPNEIETMKHPITIATGNVLTYGLGMGYYAYHVLNKQEVKHLTIVEKDLQIIEIFKKHLLSQFSNQHKITIIHADALEYAHSIKNNQFDVIFADLWHDVSDGLDLYQKLKRLESSNSTKYLYWIEDTLKCYL